MLDLSASSFSFLNSPDSTIGRRYGIEIEVENFPGTHVDQDSLSLWTVTSDSSLKVDGLEFVSKILFINQIEEALSQVYKQPRFRSKLAEFGPRTSIHIHSDMGWMTEPNDIIPFIFIYLLAEDLMYEFVAPHRRKNIYCVKTQESNYLRECFLNGQITSQTSFKYSGFNLQSLFAHGTAEFRMLEGTYNQDKIITWVNFIDGLQQYARTLPTKYTFLREVKSPTTSRDVIYSIFGAFFSDSAIEQSISNGLDYFRYLISPKTSENLINKFISDSFFSSRFYKSNFIRPVKGN